MIFFKKTLSHFKGDPDREHNRFRQLFIITSIIFLFLVPLLSLDTGINGDEKFQAPVTLTILDYYFSFGENEQALHSPAASKETAAYAEYEREYLKEHFGVENKGQLTPAQKNEFETKHHREKFGAKILMGWNNYIPGKTPQYYGAFFEIWSALFNKIFGINSKFDPDFYTIRHILSSLMGVAGMIFAGLLAALLGGWRAGFFALIFMFLSPRFLGHSYFNVKDLPFAVGYIMALYFIIRFIKELPKPSWLTVAGGMAGLGIAIGMRVGGILLIVYLFFFLGLVALWLIMKKNKQELKENAKPVLFKAICFAVGGYLTGMIFWPFGLQDPVTHPFEALRYMSDFQTNIKILFEGERIDSEKVPWYYIPKWMGITTPLFFLAGLTIVLVIGWFMRKLYDFRIILLILFAGIFPIAYVVYKDSNLYDGWRHLLFVYAPLVALSALGWDYLYNLAKDKKIGKWGLTIALGALLIIPAEWIVFHHPHEYIYFNPIIGGLEGAYKEYETDYYMNSAVLAAEWFENNIKDETVIGTDLSFPMNVYLSDDPNLKVNYTSYYDRTEAKWNYGAFYSRFVHPSQLHKGYWPPENSTVHIISTDNVPLVAILKRDQPYDLMGHQALKRKDYQKAIEHFRAELKNSPQNEGAWTGLATAYYYSGNLDNAAKAAENALQIYPAYTMALNMLGVIYMQQKEYDRAILTYSKLIDENPGFPMAYNNIGIAYAQKGQLDSAIPYLEAAIKLNPRMAQAYNVLAAIYEQKGNAQKAQQYREAAQKVR